MKRLLLLFMIIFTFNLCVAEEAPQYDVGDDVVKVYDSCEQIASINLQTLDVEVYSKDYIVQATPIIKGPMNYFVAIKTSKANQRCEYVYCSEIQKVKRETFMAQLKLKHKNRTILNPNNEAKYHIWI